MKAPTTRDEAIGQLVEVGRSAVERGLVLASGGNLSARLPGDGTEFLVTGAGTWLDRLTPADFSVVTLTGDVIGGAARPSSAVWCSPAAATSRPGCPARRSSW